jgi:hypothetical protein
MGELVSGKRGEGRRGKERRGKERKKEVTSLKLGCWRALYAVKKC